MLRLTMMWAVMLACLCACSRQTAEEKGKELATEKIDLVKGIGDALQDKGSAAAQSVAHGAGNVMQGASTGLEQALEWKLVNAESLAQNGLDVTRVQRGLASERSSKTVDVYVVAKTAVEGTLTMSVYDVAQREIARSKADLKFGADDARYETLPLDARTDLALARQVKFEFKPKQTAPAASKQSN